MAGSARARLFYPAVVWVSSPFRKFRASRVVRCLPSAFRVHVGVAASWAPVGARVRFRWARCVSAFVALSRRRRSLRIVAHRFAGLRVVPIASLFTVASLGARVAPGAWRVCRCLVALPVVRALLSTLFVSVRVASSCQEFAYGRHVGSQRSASQLVRLELCSSVLLTPLRCLPVGSE